MRFISDISLFWLLPWLVASIFIAYWFYKDEIILNDLSKRVQRLFIGLRAAVLFFLGLLLLGILFEAVDYRIEKPVFITVLDNSSSMKNYKDSSKVAEQIKVLQTKLKAQYGEKFELQSFTVGSEFKSGDKIDFNENATDLALAFEKIHADYYNRNIGGIALISDGNFNQGSNPIYSAEKIDLTPIFTFGVGDTIPKKDQYIKHVAANEIAFLKNKFPVEIDIEGIKMGKGAVQVTLQHKGKKIASQSVTFTDGVYDYKHISFLVDATEVGYQQYTVSVSEVNGEYTFINNKRSFYVEILDARSKVLLLAGAPHPDVAALKSVLEQDENLDVSSFLVNEWKRDLKHVDLVVWHEPGIQFNAAIWELFQANNIPVLFSIGPNTTNSTLQKLDLGLFVSNSSQTDEVQGKMNQGFEKFEISTDLQQAINYFPPLTVKYGDVRLSNGNDVMIYQRIGQVQKNEPLLFFGQKNKQKYGVILGEGLWKWKMNEFARKGNSLTFNELFQKITQYLVVKQNTSALRVTLPKRFTIDEDVVFKAEFYNESLELITKPTIELTVKKEGGKYNQYQFGVLSNFYELNVGRLKPGKYSWEASTKFNGKQYKKSGVFVVEDIQLEQLSTAANHTLLNQLATNSTGKFYHLNQVDRFMSDLAKRQDIAEMSYKESAFNDLIDYKWLFFFLLLLLSTEWFLRRWFGGY